MTNLPAFTCPSCDGHDVRGYQRVTSVDRLYLRLDRQDDEAVFYEIEDSKGGDVVDSGPVEFECNSCHAPVPANITTNWTER